MLKRISGREVNFEITIDGTAQTLDLALDTDVSSAWPASFGEVKLEFKIQHSDDASARRWHEFVGALAEAARETALSNLVAHIIAGGWHGRLVVYEGGWFVKDIQRLEVSAVDPSKRVVRSVMCQFDMKNDPQRYTWLSHAGHLYDPPTEDELRKAFSKPEPCNRPILGVSWIPMYVGPSGYIDQFAPQESAT